MDITGIAKSHHADIPKASSKKEWKPSDSLRERIAGYAREDAAQGVYMDRAGILGFPADWRIGEQRLLGMQE